MAEEELSRSVSSQPGGLTHSAAIKVVHNTGSEAALQEYSCSRHCVGSSSTDRVATRVGHHSYSVDSFGVEFVSPHRVATKVGYPSCPDPELDQYNMWFDTALG